MVSLSFATLLLIASTAIAGRGQGRSCGLRLTLCPEPLVCLANNATCTTLGACLGKCNDAPPTYASCGGFVPDPPVCKTGESCIADSRRPDFFLIADLPGICINNKNSRPCKGANRKCPKGMACFDDPRDSCLPGQGSNCNGICLYQKPLTP